MVQDYEPGLPSKGRRSIVRGEICPYPMLRAKEAMEGAALGEVLDLLTDHPPALTTVPWQAQKLGFTAEVRELGGADWKITLSPAGGHLSRSGQSARRGADSLHLDREAPEWPTARNKERSMLEVQLSRRGLLGASAALTATLLLAACGEEEDRHHRWDQRCSGRPARRKRLARRPFAGQQPADCGCA